MTDVAVTFLGSGDAFGSGGRFQTCILIECPTLRFLLDCRASSDTEWTDTLVKVATGADLFICEAYFFDKKIRFHLDYQSVAERKANLGCKRMVLTHMGDDILQRLSEIPIEWAEDG